MFKTIVLLITYAFSLKAPSEAKENSISQLIHLCFLASCTYSRRFKSRVRTGSSRQQGKLNSDQFSQCFESLWKSFSDDRRGLFTYFDCLWFSLYMEKLHKEKVLGWIKRKHIFSKKYVFVPIVYWSHWNLLIFCNFGELGQSETQTTCMLLLDSLQTSGPRRLEPAIRKFVLDIYKAEKRPDKKEVISQIPLLVPKVPQQTNGEDCGSFVLYFVRLFMESAPENFIISGGYPYFKEAAKFLLFAMAVAFSDLSSAAGLKKLDEYLLTRSYISGYQASKDDITVFAALSAAPASSYVNASRWYNHIDALLRISGVTGEGCGVTVEGFAPAEAVATPPAEDSKAAAAEDDDDDDVDLFGEETEEEKKAAEERAAAVKAAGKKKESGKSSVLLDIKPWDDETDMKKLEEAVRGVQMEGLLWGASKLVPVGYGIKKLQIMMTIVDDLVSVDNLIEEYLTVEPINEYVQSCDIVAFNKICKYHILKMGVCCCLECMQKQ
ncbi:Peptidase C48, SUMO/Sentrin/Ubl1 [Corchorus olitorius]|uniref:Peptidase C48, SUMO/Sentrin/Ubl1 n=1 Tax=Corchorus olitorius TaxID=93759 RepID=A0A1R3HN39_9ROSI|nr:Peptidase C48, SUMO/Sentrin/Ubl1 [Corchorus olitorius]